MKPLFHARGQLLKVRGIGLFALACAAGSLWAGFNAYQNHGLSPGDGGVLAPLPERLAWAVGISSLGVAFAIGMWIYNKCYVAKIELDEETNRLHIYTLRWLGYQKHEVDAAEVLSTRYHEGRNDGEYGSGIPTPWHTVRSKGRRLPLLLDAQGEFADKKLMRLFRS